MWPKPQQHQQQQGTKKPDGWRTKRREGLEEWRTKGPRGTKVTQAKPQWQTLQIENPICFRSIKFHTILAILSQCWERKGQNFWSFKLVISDHHTVWFNCYSWSFRISQPYSSLFIVSHTLQILSELLCTLYVLLHASSAQPICSLPSWVRVKAVTTFPSVSLPRWPKERRLGRKNVHRFSIRCSSRFDKVLSLWKFGNFDVRWLALDITGNAHRRANASNTKKTKLKAGSL